MPFFRFGRKLDVVKEYSLEEIPVFSSLTSAEQRMIEKKVRLVEFKRGDLVYEEGTPPDAFYAVISGRFHAFTKERHDTILFLYRGDHFGETSLLTGKHHSASVEAKSDGLVLKLDKDEFLKLIKDIPSLSLHLSRSLGHRLIKSENIGGRSREVKIVSLYTQGDLDQAFPFWIDFAVGVTRETTRKVILIDFIPSLYPLYREVFKRDSIPVFDFSKLEPSRESDIRSCIVEHSSGFHYLRVPAGPLQDKDDKKISMLLTMLTYRYEYLMLRLLQDLDHVTVRALKQSDVVYVYCPSSTEQLVGCTENLIEFQQGFGFSKSEIKVIVPAGNGGPELSYEEKERTLNHRIFSLLPSRSDELDRYQSTVRYISRELAGTLIGLALGSGAAYGLSHIGVLRILEKENIPVDVISGASIGALIGVLWAAGYSADELEGIAKSINRRTGFFKLLGFRDISAAHFGFFKGNQISRYLETFLGKKTFQDLRIPVKVIGANVFTSDEVVAEVGSVVDAIRASISIPGIFRPFLYRGEYLIDGGVIDPLPVRVLARMGVKKIIAVNVLCGPKDRTERNRLLEKRRIEELKTLAKKNLWLKAWSALGYRLKNRYALNVFNVIMNTIQFMEYEMAMASGNEADVYIHPEVYEGHWAQFYEPDKFIRAGEEKTKEHLAEIKRLLVE